MVLRPVDEVCNHKEIPRELHVYDRVQLILNTLPYLFGDDRIPLLQPLVCQVPQVVPLGRELRRDLEYRKPRPRELYLKVAHLLDELGVLYSLRRIGEQGRHLIRALHVELVVVECQASRRVHCLLCADADQQLLGRGVLPVQIVYVVCGYQRDACPF